MKCSTHLGVLTSLSVVLILARAEMALNFVVGVQNLTRIKQGQIALLHVDPMNMLTYDALRGWGAQLCHVGPTLAAGRSLIIATALPRGTSFNEESMPYKEVMHAVPPSPHNLPMQVTLTMQP